jgi:hypothetical protein
MSTGRLAQVEIELEPERDRDRVHAYWTLKL